MILYKKNNIKVFIMFVYYCETTKNMFLIQMFYLL